MSEETPIQHEVGRLQEMADDFVIRFPAMKEAKELAGEIVPTVERLRAQALEEIKEGGISSETYNATASAMARGEDTAWSAYDQTGDSEAKIICRQFDHIHILMNQTVDDPAPPESHKCWPPGSVCH